MRVLVGCEVSGRVRDAFRERGHEAWSADILGPDEMPDEFRAQRFPNYHLQGDVRLFLDGEAVFGKPWDLGIFHVPCTYLANSGVRWLYGGKGKVIDPDRWEKMREAAILFAECLNAPIPRIAVENPIMHRYAKEEIGDWTKRVRTNPIEIQTIQPWQFGTPETKATQLWLRNLPPLVPTNIVEGRRPRVHYASPGPNRWMERSRTDPNIAAALAEQYGTLA
jgi:hypothetical protein